MAAIAQRKPTGPMKTHTVEGGGGLQLHVREWGKADGPPILFIHGWSQNHLCWDKQYESALRDEFRLVAYDLRGHGMSEAPPGPEHYTDGKLWADDLAAIINQMGLERPVLVGWSYGAFVICDYVRAYGQDRIAAVNFVEGAVRLGEAAFASGDGRACPRHLPDRRGLLVRRRRSPAAHAGARALQPRADRADPPRPRLIRRRSEHEEREHAEQAQPAKAACRDQAPFEQEASQIAHNGAD